jgi:hypothetical protein
VSLDSALAVALAGVLVASAAAKLTSPRRSAAALITFGVRSPGLRAWCLGGLVAGELGLAAGVAVGSAGAAYAAAGALAVFGLALARVLARGGAGAPCACFGARSTVTQAAVARNLVLAAAYAGLPSVPAARPSAVAWLGAGLVLALLGLGAVSVGLLALAREIGELRLRLGPQMALELADEGPGVGRRLPLIERFALEDETRLALAVFSSEGCPMCRALDPAVDWVIGDPLVAGLRFDEHADADVWTELAVPGSPYAVVLDREGTVLAKGTFNSGGQLEGMLASAERRGALSHA